MDRVEPVSISAAGVTLEGDLTVTPQMHGIVLFAHGSGSSRFSSRNRYVAGVLNRQGFATLLMDLLTAQEEAVDMSTASSCAVSKSISSVANPSRFSIWAT